MPGEQYGGLQGKPLNRSTSIFASAKKTRISPPRKFCTVGHCAISLMALTKLTGMKMKKNVQRGVAVAAALIVSGTAFAAGDPGVDAITALSTQAQTYITAAFAVAVLVAGGFWGIKMMKKAFSKAG